MTAAPGVLAQVRALIGLRIAAVRGRPRRRALAWGAAVLAALPPASVATGLLLPAGGAQSARLLTPSAWLFFLIAAITASGTGAGGRELLPRAQAGAFPVSPAADHLGAMLMAPLNISWLAQALGLLTLAAWGVGASGGLALTLALTVLWIVACTAVAQAAGWAIELARGTPVGVWSLRALVGGVVAVLAVLLRNGSLVTILQDTPIAALAVAAVVAGSGVQVWLAARVAAELVLLTVAAWWLGVAAIGLLGRRPVRQAALWESRSHPRRPNPQGVFAACLRVDHAALWRSTPLRRGLLAVAVVPGLVAAAARLEWPMVVLLPGLVTSGAGLLFGVNAFALDGAGAIWRATLPADPLTVFASRAVVVAESCLAAGLITIVAAAIRAPGRPSAAAATAVLAALVATTAQVVALCMRWSIERPYAAALRDSRDQPAPPGAMARYSARLAASTTVVGLLFSLVARSGSVSAALFATVGSVLLSARLLLRTAQRWQAEHPRGLVIATVSGAPA